MKLNRFRIGKKFLASLLTVSVLGCGIVSTLHLYKNSEIKRVKGYLEDFLTEDNYVDMSKISGDYSIKGFDGSILRDVLNEMNIEYVRFNDSYIYNQSHVEGFDQVTATDYSKIIGEDDKNQIVYMGYEPIREPDSSGIKYIYPENYTLEEIHVYAEPIRYNELDDRKVVVVENDYDDSYSLILEKKNKR